MLEHAASGDVTALHVHDEVHDWPASQVRLVLQVELSPSLQVIEQLQVDVLLLPPAPLPELDDDDAPPAPVLPLAVV